MQLQEDAKPGEAELGNIFRQKYPPLQTVGKEATAYSHTIPSCGNNTYGFGYLGLGLYSSVSSRRTLWISTPQRRSQEEGYHGVVIIILCLSLAPSLSLTHLPLNKIHTIHFGIWSYLHLNLDRGIFNNWTVILLQKWEHKSCFLKIFQEKIQLFFFEQ